MKNRQLKSVVYMLFIVIVINVLSSFFYKRFDITADKRYSLSKTSTDIIKNMDDEILITVYLDGDFPLEFKKLQDETRLFLDEIVSINNAISYEFVNPLGLEKELIQKGMMPSQLTVEEGGKFSEAIIFPYAEIAYQDKIQTVSLLNNSITSQESQLQLAIENLEYNFVSSIDFVSQQNRKNIAYITGNGELEDIYVYSFLSDLTNKYNLAKITLDSVEKNPNQTLNQLKNFDAIILAKPTETFTDKEKLVLDQFVMKGGKSLWMIDDVVAEQDSLLTNGKLLAYPRNLNLTDLFFSYGIRINPVLVKDFYAADIKLVTGNSGNQNQYQNLKWIYHPLVAANPYHPLTKKLNPIRLQFANQIDTLKNDVSKTPLLITSPYTQKIGTPTLVELQQIAQQEPEDAFTSGSQLTGVLLEGKFNSAYKNRVLPFALPNAKSTSNPTKMIVIADGDIVKNQLVKGRPIDLERDKWTNQQFGNKAFLQNAISYLLDEEAILELRNKTIELRFLDKEKAYKQKQKWQLITIGLPLLMVFVLQILFSYLRKKKYS